MFSKKEAVTLFFECSNPKAGDNCFWKRQKFNADNTTLIDILHHALGKNSNGDKDTGAGTRRLMEEKFQVNFDKINALATDNEKEDYLCQKIWDSHLCITPRRV
jgi:hypothetical protein